VYVFHTIHQLHLIIIAHYIKNRNHTQKLNTMMETRKGSRLVCMRIRNLHFN